MDANFANDSFLREFLRAELRARRRANPAYSMRAFSRDLGYSLSRLSALLRGASGISPANAVRVAKALKLDAATESFFVMSAVAEFGRGKYLRADAAKQLQAMNVKAKGSLMSEKVRLDVDRLPELLSRLREIREEFEVPQELGQSVEVVFLNVVIPAKEL